MKTIIDFILNLFVSKKIETQNWYNILNNPDKSKETFSVGNKPITYSSPVLSRQVTSPFGYRDFDGARRWHNGVDYAGTTNSFACPPCKCQIQYNYGYDIDYPYQWKWDITKGWTRITGIPEGRGWSPYTVLVALHDSGLRFIYRHGTTKYKVGDVIEQGDYSFYEIGNYGNSAGKHLHFEVELNGKNIDPEKWIEENT